MLIKGLLCLEGPELQFYLPGTVKPPKAMLSFFTTIFFLAFLPQDFC